MFYKVVAKNERGEYVSAVASTATELMPYSLIYRQDVWTKPKIGKIMCFNDLELARHWANSNNGFKMLYIFEAEVIHPVVGTHTPLFSQAVEFWAGKLNLKNNCVMTAPEGTYFVNKLKISEKEYSVI